MTNIAPIYTTRMPIGKRLLQLPPIAQISAQAISSIGSRHGFSEPLASKANCEDLTLS